MRIGSHSIFASAALSLTNKFSEFFHKAMDARQAFASLCELSQRENTKYYNVDNYIHDIMIFLRIPLYNQTN